MPHSTPTLLSAQGARADAANALPLGHRLHEFEMRDVIGVGGFGIVYRAFDPDLDREVDTIVTPDGPVYTLSVEEVAMNHPSVGEARGLGVFWALDLVRDRKTREPLVPFNASGADAKPMGELMAACKANGVWPFAHFNRLQITPPCTTTDDEAREGLAGIDKALDVADKYYTG